MEHVPPLEAGSTDERLVRATEENLFALFRAMATHLPGSDLERGHALSRHHASPTNPMFKGVWDTRLTTDDLDAAISECIEWFRARGAPYFFWWSGPSSAPATLGSRLRAHGLMDMAEQQQTLAAGIQQTAMGAPIMVADLARMNRDVLGSLPHDYRLSEVVDDEGLAAFKHVFVSTYQIPDWAGQAWVDATRTIGVGRTPWRMFVGYLGETPVATNMLFVGGGVASVYAVAVLPEAQGRGLGAAVTLAPLLQAHEAGMHHAVLFSTEMGYRVYRRIGFRDTGARLNRYMWRSAIG